MLNFTTNSWPGLWSELENYTKIPHCTCGKCNCKIKEKIMNMVDDEKTYQFLMGLTVSLLQMYAAKFSHMILYHILIPYLI